MSGRGRKIASAEKHLAATGGWWRFVAVRIVGASCRFPGAAGLKAFWRLLIDGVDGVSDVGAERWSTRFFYHPKQGEPGKTYSGAAGLIDDIDRFDPGFFGISPREAAEMDPQQRVLLELAWHALEDAGIPATRFYGSATGVYVGASSTDYGDLRFGDPASGGQYLVTGMSLSILANRISHVFDLRGPSLVVDTACSSSLVALHEACEALRADRIDAALVGGINLLLSPYPFIGFAQAGMLSRRGRCFAFDARADGYVRSEGGAVVVLKRLERALADGDQVRAVIRGTAVSASGRTIGLSLPSATAQAALLRSVYGAAGVAPDALAFIEMHGTGTPAGDPAEAAAVGQMLGQARAERLPIGSVKTNIGHLEPASGMAGLLKAVLALERGILPRSLYGETPSPAIPFDRLNLRLVISPEAIAPGTYAGINSFGFGGTNAHAILSAAPKREPIAEIDTPLPPLLISARGEAALRALAQEWRDTLAATPVERMSSLFRAALRRRDHHSYRLVVAGDDPAATLGDFLAGRANPAAVVGAASGAGKLAFVYSGNGAQFLGMGAAAYRAGAPFRAAIAKVDGALCSHLGWSVGDRIAGGVASADLRRADIAQPMLFAIQTAITAVLRDIGTVASGFVGHSVGEITAAWAAGALSLDAAARVVAARSRHQERVRGTGRMAVLALGEAETRALIAKFLCSLEIAAINSARSVTVAGDAASVARLGEEAERNGIAWRALDLDFAFHSAAMEPIREGLLGDLNGIASVAPAGDLISTVTGGLAAGVLDAMHWWRNVRDPVRFAAAVETLISDGYRIFVEIGPNPVLLPYLREALRGSRPAGQAIATLNRRTVSGDPFLPIVARLYVAGHDISGSPWFVGPDDVRGLPLYPWQRERCWFGRTVEALEQVNPILDHALLGFRQNGPIPSWLNHLDTTLFPFLADHRVDGVPVLPAAAIIDMALAAARANHSGAAALELQDLELRRPITLDGAHEMRSTLLPDGDWQIAGRRRLADEPLVVHAMARLTVAASDRPLLTFDNSVERRVVAGAELYRHAARLGLDYGESFRLVRKVVLSGGTQAMVLLTPPTLVASEYLIAPTSLDGALQGLLALLLDDGPLQARFLPCRVGRVRALAPFGRLPGRAELRLTRRGARLVVADIALYDVAGNLAAELVDCGFARVDFPRSITDHCLWADLVPAPLGDMPQPAILDRLPEMQRRIAAGQTSDRAREAEQALLFDALIAAIGREAFPKGVPIPEPLHALLRRFGEDDLPESGELWRLLLAESPEMVAELALAAMLRERRPFDPATVAALRQSSPPAAAAKAMIAAALDEITAAWPCDRVLRICELGATGLCDRLRTLTATVRRVGEGEPCDIAVCGEAGGFDSSRVKLAPGGVALAVMPVANPLWEVVVGRVPDWREEWLATGLSEFGSIAASLGPWPCEVVWARAPTGSEAGVSSAPLSIGLITDGAEIGLADALRTAGHRVLVGDATGDVIVLAVGGVADPVAEASRGLPLLARVAAQAAERQIPLWLMTSGVQQPGNDDGLIGATLWGLGRVLRNEMPGLELCLVDLPPDIPRPERARLLARELEARTTESEIVWTPLGRHVLRLRRGLPPVGVGPGEAVVAASASPGRLDRLVWTPVRRRPPEPGEIEIEVHAAGINFRDVMAATGVLPETALGDGFAGAALGLECAGTVCAIGDGVDSVAIGDRVVGLAPAAVTSHVVTRADAVIAIPREMSFAAAATLPVAFVTAIYSLRTLARLAPGESVLIQAASGGVGLAAIQIAKACGATVIAAAGSPTKRAFLRLVGADHVCASRELRFVASVREATGGAGVDVVLNSLSGEAVEASLELLKPFGRFIELGKRDFLENRRLRTRLLQQNVAYFAVDVDQLPVRRPELAKSLLGEVAAALADGEIRPLTHRCFAFAQIGDAFRLMQAGQHIGKLVLIPDGKRGIAVARPAEMKLRKQGSYVVTGGLGGFGLATGRWLAEQGAGHLALIGRRGSETPGVAERIAELESYGTVVSVHAVDVADADALAAALAAIRAQGPPIHGVVHAAGAIIDGMAATLSSAQIAVSLRAKLGGAILLDRLTRDDPLDLFWVFSSATTMIGAPGQGAYVAANQALETLARTRHAKKRPALAIAWGPIADVGVLAERSNDRKALARRLAARPMSASMALSALPVLAASGLPVVALADVSWNEASHTLPILAAPFFDEIRGTVTAVVADVTFLDRLVGLDDAERHDILAAIVAEEAARILRLSDQGIDHNRPLAELGMDSLMAIELRLAIETRLRLDLPLMSLADGASAATLATRIAELLTRPTPVEPVIELAAQYEAPLAAFAPGQVDLAAEA
jgi:phthiocerol/phenolphthiocerol synthesis type-I polyketide synthase C